MYNNKLLSFALVAIILALIALFSLSMKSVEANESKSLRENIQHELSNTNNIQASAACQFPGNYCDSCKGCYEYGGWLVCQCYDTSGVLDGGTMIKLSDCPNGYILNVNSDLTCFKQAPTSCKYPGDYCTKCTNCRESGTTLTCSCPGFMDGKYYDQSINVLSCPKGTIGLFVSLTCFGFL